MQNRLITQDERQNHRSVILKDIVSARRVGQKRRFCWNAGASQAGGKRRALRKIGACGWTGSVSNFAICRNFHSLCCGGFLCSFGLWFGCGLLCGLGFFLRGKFLFDLRSDGFDVYLVKLGGIAEYLYSVCV